MGERRLEFSSIMSLHFAFCSDPHIVCKTIESHINLLEQTGEAERVRELIM